MANANNPLNYSLGELKKAIGAGFAGVLAAIPSLVLAKANVGADLGIIVGSFVLPFAAAFGFTNTSNPAPATATVIVPQSVNSVVPPAAPAAPNVIENVPVISPFPPQS